MTPTQRKKALEGLQDRINRIAKKYKREVRRNHDMKYSKKFVDLQEE